MRNNVAVRAQLRKMEEQQKIQVVDHAGVRRKRLHARDERVPVLARAVEAEIRTAIRRTSSIAPRRRLQPGDVTTITDLRSPNTYLSPPSEASFSRNRIVSTRCSENASPSAWRPSCLDHGDGSSVRASDLASWIAFAGWSLRRHWPRAAFRWRPRTSGLLMKHRLYRRPDWDPELRPRTTRPGGARQAVAIDLLGRIQRHRLEPDQALALLRLELTARARHRSTTARSATCRRRCRSPTAPPNSSPSRSPRRTPAARVTRGNAPTKRDCCQLRGPSRQRFTVPVHVHLWLRRVAVEVSRHAGILHGVLDAADEPSFNYNTEIDIVEILGGHPTRSS